jgi:hypothetical protein
LNAPDDADADYPPTCSELGPATCSGPCQRDDAASCLHLAEGYMAGAGLARDPQRALGLMQKSCDLGFGRACGYLAAAIGRHDPARAKKLGKLGCDKGYGGACIWYVGHHVVAGVPPNWREAAPFLQRGCDAGHARACLLWGDLLRTGEGVTRDPAGASAAYAKACEAGESEACRLAEAAPDGAIVHDLATEHPTHADVASTNHRGNFQIEVQLCVTSQGTTEVEAVTGAPEKLSALIRAAVESWRFAPTGSAEPSCTAVKFAYEIG